MAQIVLSGVTISTLITRRIDFTRPALEIIASIECHGRPINISSPIAQFAFSEPTSQFGIMPMQFLLTDANSPCAPSCGNKIGEFTQMHYPRITPLVEFLANVFKVNWGRAINSAYLAAYFGALLIHASP